MNFDLPSSEPKRRPSRSLDILNRASGHWPHLLMVVGGLPEHYLSGSHQPCPCCGGDDRYRWITDEGPGGWYCTHCGGKDQRGGGGSGVDMLMRFRKWSFKESIKEVEKYYDGLPFSVPEKKKTPLPKQLSTGYKHSELERYQLLEIAGQLGKNDLFSPAGAKARIYSKRWAAYAAANLDAAMSTILQFETERGTVDWPKA